MTQLNTKPFPQLAPSGTPTGMGLPQVNPIDTLSQAQFNDLMEMQANDPVMTPVQRTLEQTYGKQVLGLASSSFTGYLGDWIGRVASKWMFDDKAYETPLNLTDDITQSGGINYSDNVLDRLIDMVESNNVPWEQWGYIFEAPTVGDFHDRLERTVLGNPETTQFGGNWGKALGFASDTSGLMLLGAALEPAVFIGTGIKGAAAGAARASQASTTFGRSVSVANEAAHWVNHTSRLGILGRSAAVGIGEESIVKGIQLTTDPTYEGDAENIAMDYAMSVGGWSIVGGLFGKNIAKTRFEKEYNRAKINYVGPTGMSLVEWRGPLDFGSSIMDRELMENGSGRILGTMVNLGDTMHGNYSAWAATGVSLDNIMTSTSLSGAEKAAIAVMWNMDGGVAGAVTNVDTGRSIINAIWKSHAEGAAKGGDQAFWTAVADKLVGTVPDPILVRMKTAARRGSMPKIAFDELFMGLPDLDAYKMVDELVETINSGTPTPETLKSLDVAGERAFTIAMLREMANRGHVLTTGNALELLREFGKVVKNPPIVTTKSGPAIDEATLGTQLIDVANRYLPAGNKISLTPAAQAKLAELASVTAVTLTAGGLKAGPGMPVLTSAGTLSRNNEQSLRLMDAEIPILNQWTDTLPGPFRWLFNQAAPALTSKHSLLRYFAYRTMNARRVLETPNGRIMGQPVTVTEVGHLANQTDNYTTGQIMRNGYARFVMGLKPTDRVGIMKAIRVGFGPGSAEKWAEFNRRVMIQQDSGLFNDPIDVINEVARATQQLRQPRYNKAHALDIRGYRNLKYLNHVPHHWEAPTLRKLLAHSQGREKLIELLKQSMKDAGILDPATGKHLRQMILDNGKVFQYDDIDAAATVFADVLLSRANQMDQAPLVETDEAIKKALAELAGPIKGDKAIRSRAGKGRVNLKTGTTINTGVDLLGNGRTTLSIMDLIDNDQTRINRDYFNSVQGAINEKMLLDDINELFKSWGIMKPTMKTKKGKVRKPKPLKLTSLDQLEPTLNRLASKYPKVYGEALTMAERSALNSLISAARMIPVVRPETPADLENLSRIATTLSYMVSGGRFMWAQVSEMFRVVGTYGLRAAIAEIPTIVEVMQNWKNLGEGPKTAVVLLTDSFGIGVDRQLRNIIRASPLDAERISGKLAPLRRAFDKTAAAYSDFEGLAPMTSLTQQMAASSALHHLLDVARNKAKFMDDATVRTWGLEPDQYRELVAWIGANANTYKKMGFTRIKGFKNYPPEVMTRLSGFIHRATVTRIQDYATRGDMHDVAFTWWGRLMLQFQTFTLKGVDNLMFQNLSRITRGDAQSRMQVAREMAAVLFGAWLVKYGLNYSDWWSADARGDREEADRIAEQKLGARASVLEAMNYVGDFYLPMMAFEKGYATFFDRSGLSSDYRARQHGGYSIPVLSQYKRAAEVSGDVMGALMYEMTGSEAVHRDITTATTRKIRTLLPFQNLWYLKHVFNLTKDNVDMTFELPDRQLPSR